MCESNNQYALSPVSMYTTNKAKPEDQRRKERKKGRGLGERKGGRKKEGRVSAKKRKRDRD